MAEIKGKSIPIYGFIKRKQAPDGKGRKNELTKLNVKKRFPDFGVFELFHILGTVPGINMGFLFILLGVFLLTSCSGGKKEASLFNDDLYSAFVKYEKVNVDQSDIRVPGYVKYSFVKTYYDMNHDKKPDFIKYQPFLYSTFDMQSGNGMIVWSKNWFRIDVDNNAEGNFDFYVYRNPDGKLVSYNFNDVYGKHQ